MDGAVFLQNRICKKTAKHSTKSQQYDRLMLRDQLTYEQAGMRVNAQVSIDQKKDLKLVFSLSAMIIGQT